MFSALSSFDPKIYEISARATSHDCVLLQYSLHLLINKRSCVFSWIRWRPKTTSKLEIKSPESNDATLRETINCILQIPTWIVTNSSLIYWIKCDVQRLRALLQQEKSGVHYLRINVISMWNESTADTRKESCSSRRRSKKIATAKSMSYTRVCFSFFRRYQHHSSFFRWIIHWTRYIGNWFLIVVTFLRYWTTHSATFYGEFAVWWCLCFVCLRWFVCRIWLEKCSSSSSTCTRSEQKKRSARLSSGCSLELKIDFFIYFYFQHFFFSISIHHLWE